LTPQSGVRAPVAPATGSRLMSGITRDAMTVVKSLVEAEKDKVWKIGDYEFNDGVPTDSYFGGWVRCKRPRRPAQ
jgi:hypothetical protein